MSAAAGPDGMTDAARTVLRETQAQLCDAWAEKSALIAAVIRRDIQIQALNLEILQLRGGKLDATPDPERIAKAAASIGPGWMDGITTP